VESESQNPDGACRLTPARPRRRDRSGLHLASLRASDNRHSEKSDKHSESHHATYDLARAVLLASRRVLGVVTRRCAGPLLQRPVVACGVSSRCLEKPSFSGPGPMTQRLMPCGCMCLARGRRGTPCRHGSPASGCPTKCTRGRRRRRGRPLVRGCRKTTSRQVRSGW